MKDNHKETRVMSENKKPPIVSKGKTETAQAVTQPKMITAGKTESPQAVIKPTTPKQKE